MSCNSADAMRLEAVQGEPIRLSIRWPATGGGYISLTDSAPRMDVRDPQSWAVVATASLGSGFTLSESDTLLSLTLTIPATVAPGRYLFDLCLTVGGNLWYPLRGTVTVSRRVTVP